MDILYITTSGFRPPYWKCKFMKIVKMSTDCNPTLIAYYRKLTYCLHICYFSHYLQQSSNYTKKAKNNWKLINFRPSSTFGRLLNAKNRMKKYGPVLELEGGLLQPPPPWPKMLQKSMAVRGLTVRCRYDVTGAAGRV